ncbi:hypothetical protein BV25DRAFT_1164886 [Artomyces pyxidatus]|uniref:Uncharacterized protein n=1 Tax=Artomyces pyxidatus TaxID=48021 RepID=A0ACB8SSW7_9AGAM|nr:hypothetical protein BV25DRAFT_1164886 [Artomyces pyxidatus]
MLPLEEVIHLDHVDEGAPVSYDGDRTTVGEDQLDSLPGQPRALETPNHSQDKEPWGGVHDHLSWSPDGDDESHSGRFRAGCPLDTNWCRWAADAPTDAVHSPNHGDSMWNVGNDFDIWGESPRYASPSATPSFPTTIASLFDVTSRFSTPDLNDIPRPYAPPPGRNICGSEDLAATPPIPSFTPTVPESSIVQAQATSPAVAVDGEVSGSQPESPVVIHEVRRKTRGGKTPKASRKTTTVHRMSMSTTQSPAAAEPAGRQRRMRRAAAEQALEKITLSSNVEDHLADLPVALRGLGGSGESLPGPSSSSNPGSSSHARLKKAGPKRDQGSKWVCKDCKEAFTRRYDMKRHMTSSSSHQAKRYLCRACSFTFTRSDALKRHAFQQHGLHIPHPPLTLPLHGRL